MKASKFIFTSLLGILLLPGSPAFAQGNSQGHGHGKGHDKHRDDDDRDDRYDHHREAIRGWYSEHESHLPPGPAPDCAHVLISGHIVLLNRKTNLIVDVFSF